MLLIPDLAFLKKVFLFLPPSPICHPASLPQIKHRDCQIIIIWSNVQAFFYIYYLIDFFRCVQPLVSCATDVPQLLRQRSDD